MFSVLNQEFPGWTEPYLRKKYGKGKPLSKEALEKMDRALEWLKTQPEDTSPD